METSLFNILNKLKVCGKGSWGADMDGSGYEKGCWRFMNHFLLFIWFLPHVTQSCWNNCVSRGYFADQSIVDALEAILYNNLIHFACAVGACANKDNYDR
jgi:hypothetical protein